MSIMYNISRACTIYCEGPVLRSIQLAQIFNDSKTFVDMPMIYEPEETLSAYYALSDPNNATELKEYVYSYFLPAGSDLAKWYPPDYNPDAAIIEALPDDYEYKQWTKDLNELWTILGRNITESVLQHPEKHSFLPRNHPMIVPGGRFRESYYWDSWFIMRGLLVCDMNTTAYYVISNLLEDIENFGFVPNGGRIYYLDRSQPPVLSEMVLDYFSYNVRITGMTTSLTQFLTRSFQALQTEYNWWMNETNGHVITFNNTNTLTEGTRVFETWQLNRYHSNATSPRPESYYEDYENSLQSIRDNTTVNQFYRDTRAGAESGWDFSSRWIEGLTNLSYIATSNIIPVELNTFLYKMELNLARINGILVAEEGVLSYVSVNYTLAALRRKEAMNSLLFDNSSFLYVDYNLTSFSQAVRNASGTYSTVASFLPLWAQIYPNPNNDVISGIHEEITPVNCHRFLTTLEDSNLLQPGGVLTTTVMTGQQWDSPNAWPPLVMLLIEGLLRMGPAPCPQAVQLAQNLSSLWLATNYQAYNKTGFMYEKYNAFVVGEGGGGGEYIPQVGFGWSNGVALVLINATYRGGDYPFIVTDDYTDDSSNPTVIAVSVIFPILFVLGVIAWCVVYPRYQRNLGLQQSLLTSAGVAQPVIVPEVNVVVVNPVAVANNSSTHQQQGRSESGSWGDKL